MTEIQIKELAIKYCEKEIFTSLEVMHLKSIQELSNIFTPLKYIKEKEMTSIAGKNPAFFFEETSKSVGTYLGKYPVFNSFQILEYKDIDIFMESYTQYMKSKQEATK